MQLFLQQLMDGIATGALYGAMALSIVLVYRASGIVNFAQGEMAMFAAFIAWQAYAWGVPLWLAIVIAMIIAFIGGALAERLLIRPFGTEKSGHLPLIIVTLGLMLMLNSGAAWIWGYLTKEVPPVYGSGGLSIAGASISRQGLGIILTVAVGAGLLFFLFQRTKLGLTMRAAASNPESARLSGVPVGRMLLFGWGLAAAVGALVGALVAPQLFLQPNMMASLLLYAFAAATLGGFDSPVGALVGGLVVGVSENLAGTYIPFIGNEFKQAVALVIIMAVLLLKPEGLFGAKTVTRV
ncbi:amino acid/amide ABC transporter membrane protein 1 (HAAT family) [Antricoccus suffuscus]|uniref:Amino acid/amide ABC transporter membrane protein 1 (HAAT family) n=1 Tax=Antricoccus suffuscus TaxID=1629062 RepID=A0A2T0ZZX8_9ACTN|nr:branched-chain amino acid ABC transporter permease [Antricoccus suffuscus]PRZ41797.1 amino acid/amide ABC transporter membrane protein 1 (HAAT family) [Antricoccus suffuscus]